MCRLTIHIILAMWLLYIIRVTASNQTVDNERTYIIIIKYFSIYNIVVVAVTRCSVARVDAVCFIKAQRDKCG